MKKEIEKRVCCECKIAKPLTHEYFPRRTSSSAKGFQYFCRVCRSSHGKELYAIKKEKHKALVAKWQKENPEKKNAHIIVNTAIKKGDLVRGVCKECGNPKVHAHHEDYRSPLDVMWLCAKHHRMLHVLVKDKIRTT